jgi:hypothetical protein
MAEIAVTMRGNLINFWWLPIFTRPFATINGDEYQLRWLREQMIEVGPGSLRIESFIKYRGFSKQLGVDGCETQIPAGERVEIMAVNGITSGSPFTPKIVGRDDASV